MIVGCCPATNGQKAIQQCELIPLGNGASCPSHKPQHLTSVYQTIFNIGGFLPDRNVYGFCCPAEPVCSSHKMSSLPFYSGYLAAAEICSQ